MSQASPESIEKKEVVISDPQHVVKHGRFGIWDYYEETGPGAERITIRDIFAGARETLASFPYLHRAVKTILEIPGCKTQVAVYSTASFVAAVVPVISVW